MHSLIVDTCGTTRSVLVEASDVEPLVQRNHVSGGTMYLEGPRIWWDCVYRGTLYLEGRDHIYRRTMYHVWEHVYEGTVCTEGQP